MGTSNIPTATDGNPIPASDHNSLADALKVDVVPRNSSGNATDIAGSLGTSLFRWLKIYVQKIYIGAAASVLTIEEASGALYIKLAGVTIFKTDTNGFDGAYMKAASLAFASFASGQEPLSRAQNFTASGTFTVPSGVSEVLVIGCGGGGGGGGNVTGGGNGGNGGSGSQLGVHRVAVTPGGSVTVTVGGGGNGGTGSAAGSNGGTSAFGSISFRGGDGGAPGSSGASGRDPSYNMGIGGRQGPVVSSDGEAGGDSASYAGGAAGTWAGVGSIRGAGGGGAGPFGNGGAGGVGGISGANGTAASGNSGGGGGGAGASTNASKVGGAGSSGRVTVMWSGNA